ncbi:sensor histidine kinase [Glycomyces paridis]|uniref:histidine kinase n=1 Tax=Glycomyces paridis TaxID=2126555 RepID=A0A4S8PQ45_9ACTN|nr:histidine kinase [Glycomyces paridis]THV30689.1 sensor histidine kinase [Glycomyces paridis]
MNAVHALLARPRAAGARGPRVRDVAVVAALAAVATAEGALRPDLDWPRVTTLVTVAILPVLLWRRSRPLPVVAAMTAATFAFALAQALSGIDPDALVTTFAFLTVPYALFRWGSGRDQAVGAAVIAAGLAATSWLGRDPVADLIAGIVFMGGACLIGELRRERVEARARHLDAVRAREREALARDLHDTVAHHVSVIVIRAQVAASDPNDAARVTESLDVIEREAQAVLADMRSLVRALRAPADYAPSPGLAELARLAEAGPPPVRVRIDAPNLPGIVASTLFRIAQEGVTNARKHAGAATRIDVTVATDEDTVRLTVHDDGAPARPPSGDGHGLQGMSERAALLGGEVAAGPDPGGGWTLRAALPLVEAVAEKGPR